MRSVAIGRGQVELPHEPLLHDDPRRFRPVVDSGLVRGIAEMPADRSRADEEILVNTASDCGLVLDRMEEPAYPRGTPSENPLSHASFEFVPWVLSGWFRVANPT